MSISQFELITAALSVKMSKLLMSELRFHITKEVLFQNLWWLWNTEDKRSL